MSFDSKLRGIARPVYQKWLALSFNQKRNRKKIVDPYFHQKLELAGGWTKQRTESDNFYYELTFDNQLELSSLIAVISGESPEVIDGFIIEIQTDEDLREHLSRTWVDDPTMRDAQLAYGRRIGWYALARVLKPKLIIETGVHHGVGACVLTSALIRNRVDGSPGRYLGTDIDPGAGTLLNGRYAREGRIAYGDSITTLRTIDTPIDFFINDSDHSADYEAQEYETILPLLAKNSIVLGDNSHTNTKLNDFSRQQDRPYLFFREVPANHWYPGAGIGISVSAIPLKLE
jgi:hypothetical protein